MAITVLVQGTSIGIDAGPFNIYHTSVDAANILGSINYTRTQLLAGLTFSNVPDGVNSFYIVSSGICGNSGSANLVVPTNSPTAAPTASPTASPTAAPVTPAPVTPAPVTPSPVTPSPTAAPVTPAPVTPSPITPSPTEAPVTPAPVTPAPVTPSPTAAPVTPAPVTPAPVTPAPVTPAPATPVGMCWTVTYSSVPNDLYLRWRRSIDDTVVTELITSIETIDNGNGTYTVGVCAAISGAYNTPVFVQGGIEIGGGAYDLTAGGSCTGNSGCLIGQSAPAPVTPAPTAPAPTTPSPYPAPVTPSPTEAPVTPAPVTPAPSSGGGGGGGGGSAPTQGPPTSGDGGGGREENFQ